MAEWDRVLAATHEHFLKGVSNETLEERALLTMLKNRGRIRYNEFGDQLTWSVKYKKRALTPYADMQGTTFQRQSLWQKPALDWRGYNMQDAISKKERLMNRGNAAIFRLYGRMAEDMKDDFLELFNAELYKDGNAAGNELRFHGLGSIFGYTAGATEFVAANETYAGLSMAATYGTAAATTYWSPILVNECYSGFGTWASNPLEVSRALLIACTHGNSRKGRPDLLLTAENRYRQFLTKLQAEERIVADATELTKVGFQAVQFDGAALTHDADIPNGAHSTGSVDNAGTLCLNVDQMELRMLSGQLVDGDSGYDIGRKAWMFSMDTFGNMKVNPRYIGKASDFRS